MPQSLLPLKQTNQRRRPVNRRDRGKSCPTRKGAAYYANTDIQVGLPVNTGHYDRRAHRECGSSGIPARTQRSSEESD